MARQAGAYLQTEFLVRKGRQANQYRAPNKPATNKPAITAAMFPSVPTHVPTSSAPKFPAVPTHALTTRAPSRECGKCAQLYVRYKAQINHYRNWLKYLYDTIGTTYINGVYQMNRNHHNYKQFQTVMIQYRTLLKEIRKQIENHITPSNSRDHSALLRLINRRIQLLTNCTDDTSPLRPHCKANQIDMFRYVNGRPMSVI